MKRGSAVGISHTCFTWHVHNLSVLIEPVANLLEKHKFKLARRLLQDLLQPGGKVLH